MKINFKNFAPTKIGLNQPLQKSQPNPSYGSNKDTFEKSKQSEILTYEIWHEDTLSKVKVKQNPLDKARVYKKVWNQQTQKYEKIPVFVDVAMTEDEYETIYYFIEPETKKEIGFLVIKDSKKILKSEEDYYEDLADQGFWNNFHKEGIHGDRAFIEYLQNNEEGTYSGIGRAADQIAVEYCIKRGIKPNVISTATEKSIIAHYKRGKRFIHIDKNPNISTKRFVDKFHTKNPNLIIQKRIENAKFGEIIDTSDLGELIMYLPQKMIKKYEKLAEENPILH